MRPPDDDDDPASQMPADQTPTDQTPTDQKPLSRLQRGIFQVNMAMLYVGLGALAYAMTPYGKTFWNSRVGQAAAAFGVSLWSLTHLVSFVIDGGFRPEVWRRIWSWPMRVAVSCGALGGLLLLVKHSAVANRLAWWLFSAGLVSLMVFLVWMVGLMIQEIGAPPAPRPPAARPDDSGGA